MKKRFLIVFIGLIVLVVIIFIVVFSLFQKVNVITDKKEYQPGDNLRVKIKNNLGKNICLSSCYPYYFEKKEEGWESYPYGDCPDTNLVENCINPRQTKAFETVIPSITTGLYRLALPACLGCNLQEKFREDEWFYSREFIIK